MLQTECALLGISSFLNVLKQTELFLECDFFGMLHKWNVHVWNVLKIESAFLECAFFAQIRLCSLWNVV